MKAFAENSNGVKGAPRVVGRAAVFSSPRQISIEQIEFREPKSGEVRVRVEGCGVCSSNIPIWEGRPWFEYPIEPGAPGHEAWGRVDAVGDTVVSLKPGDRVAMLSGNSYADYDFAATDEVLKLPKFLDNTMFPGEPLGCAMNVFGRSQIKVGQTVAIIGIGFLGALLTKLATDAGARVLAISRRASSLRTAKEFGAAEVISLTTEKQVTDDVLDLTHGRGCDCVIEAVGNQQALDLATTLTCERGRLVIAGYHQDGLRQVNMQVWNWRGLDVINAHERDPAKYLYGMRKALWAVESGVIDPSSLYTHQFPLNKIDEAFNEMTKRADGFTKALIML